jgi:hypothetical protein
VQGYLDNPGCGLRSIADSGTITNYFACFPQAAAVAARQGVGPKSRHAAGLAVMQAHTFCNTWQKSAFL